MKNGWQKFAAGVITITTLLLGAWLHYYLPSTSLVRIVGTEVKRADSSPTKIRDVRFIVTADVETGKTKMFRNEDMGWPPYFKFNSGDLSGEVMNLEKNRPNATIAVTHYGWRLPLFSLYPNATRVKEVAVDFKPTYWVSSLSLTLIVPLWIFGCFRFWKLVNRASDAIDRKVESLS
jgi:hypothetical protein